AVTAGAAPLPKAKKDLRGLENADQDVNTATGNNAVTENFITTQNIAVASDAVTLNSAQQAAKPLGRASNAVPAQSASAEQQSYAGAAKNAVAAGTTETVTVTQSPSVEVAPLSSSYHGDLQQSQLQAAAAPPQPAARMQAAPPPPQPAFAGEAVSSLSAKSLAQPIHWRISAEGRVERQIGAGSWVLATPPDAAKMRVVAVVGHRVWTGGEGLRLYTSVDNGVTWRLVALAAKRAPALDAGGDAAITGRAAMGGLAKDQRAAGTGGPTSAPAITHIRFSSEETGAIEADNGAQWTTSDSGATWK